MRIKKNRVVKASEEFEELDVMEPGLESELEPEAGPEVEPEVCPYGECIDYIHQAIDCLATCAKDDPIAKESIANLSVVLLDLQQ